MSAWRIGVAPYDFLVFCALIAFVHAVGLCFSLGVVITVVYAFVLGDVHAESESNTDPSPEPIHVSQRLPNTDAVVVIVGHSNAHAHSVWNSDSQCDANSQSAGDRYDDICSACKLMLLQVGLFGLGSFLCSCYDDDVVDDVY